MEDYLLIIDGSSLLSTQFYGNLPREVLMAKTVEEKEKYYHKIMQTSKGIYTNAVYGFLRSLFSILEHQRPAYLAVTWDLTRDTFRRRLYADYKGNRSETIYPLSSQFALMQEVLGKMGIPQFMSEEYEADDYSGTLARKFSGKIPVKILTKDHDYLQLADENTTIWLLQTNQQKADELFKKYRLTKDGSCPEKAFPMDPETIRLEFGVSPSSVAALKGLMGDSSDNIKGVPGIGPVTAVSLIGKYGSVENLYGELSGKDEEALKLLAAEWKEELGIKRSPISALLKKSEEELCGRKAAFLSETLATIKTDIPLSEELSDLRLRLKVPETERCLRELEISSVKIPEGLSSGTEEAAEFPKPQETEIDDFDAAENLFKRLSGGKALGLAVTEAHDTLILFDGTAVYTILLRFFITPEYVSEKLLVLQKTGTVLCGLDSKRLDPFVSDLEGTVFDAGIADYLLRPLDSEHGFSVLANEYLLQHPEPNPKNEAVLALLLLKPLSKALSDRGLEKIYREIELPLAFVLREMEHNGIRVNREALLSFGQGMEEEIAEEERKVFALSGESFNILSPKQLGEVLFEKMKLPNGKKTKTGYSTSADILEKLAEDYEVVGHVLNYRKLSKLKNTYVDSLPDYIRPDGRIHSSFNQTVTATGRLSSSEPNLQNIPIRTELGRSIRKVFIPEEGWSFTDADYSQIELRLLAHMSGDESLISAFHSGKDIHRATAARVFGKSYEEVSPAERSAAKAVNFGIIYGISSFGLGQGLNISRADASKYIESYFAEYPGIKSFLDSLVDRARESGYAETLYGRKRPIPELSADNFMTRSFGERVAMNMPIQGTAADIMKLAMLNTFRSFKEHGLRSRILVQVHDELLIETCPGEEETVRRLLTEAMEGAAELKVPLLVDVKTGNTWYEAK